MDDSQWHKFLFVTKYPQSSIAC